MSKVVGLLALCVVLAIFRAVVLALAAALMLGLIYSFVRRPRDTLLFLATCALSCVAVAKPLACIVGVTVVALALVLAGRRRMPPISPHRPRIR